MIKNENELLAKLNKISVEKYEIIETKENVPTMRFEYEGKKFFLHSKYAPSKQAKEFADSVNDGTKNIAVYGLGLGYHVAELIKNILPTQKLFVIEANLAIIKLAFENTDIKSILQHEAVTFIGTDDAAEFSSALLEILSLTELKFSIYETSLKLVPPPLAEYGDLMLNYVSRVKSLTLFEPLLQQNKDYNESAGYKDGGVLFKNKFKGVPGIIVSGGYSLNLNMMELHSAKGKAVTIAIGRVARMLESNNAIVPDFYIETDAKPGFEHRFTKIENTSTPLLMLSTASKRLEAYKGEKLLLHEKLGAAPEHKQYSVEVGGSVACAAASALQLMGCNPIIFVGQDLCFINDYTHANTKATVGDLRINGRYVKGVDGKQYFTYMDLYHFLKWFERFIRAHSETEFINCTALGANIEGAAWKNLKEYLDSLPELSFDVKSTISKILEND